MALSKLLFKIFFKKSCFLNIRCDQCQNDVVGIRFDCVHCPSLTFCEKCEQQATLDHLTQNQTNQQQHIFKLIMTPEEEAYSF